MATNDYGFSENLIVETKVIDRDKHGFIRVTDATGKSGNSSLPTLFVHEQGIDIDRVCMFIVCSDDMEVVYGELTESDFSTSTGLPVPSALYAVFSDENIDFTGINTENNHPVEDFLDTHGISYTRFHDLNPDPSTELPFDYYTASSSDAFKMIRWEHFSIDDSDDCIVPDYARILHADRNDPIQIFAKYRNNENTNDFSIVKFGAFSWPLHKTVSYNPNGPLSASVKNAELYITLNLEGFAKYTMPKMLFVSQTDYRETGYVTLSECAPVFAANVPGTSQNLHIRSFDLLEGSVEIDGGFYEGEDNPLYLYGCHQENYDWVIDESFEIIVDNYEGGLV